MSTIILKNKNKEVFLIPDWTMEHAGFIKNKEGKNVGHTDIKNSTGSTFNPSVDAMTLFRQIINGDNVEHINAVYQANFTTPVGWSALNTNAKKITGVILKQEAPEGSKIVSTVLAPAYENLKFGEPQTQTSIFSAIAPITNELQFLPDDVKNDSKVLEAMEKGNLRTFVSIFPGPIIFNNQDLPKVSQFQKGIAFEVHPENNMYIKINASNEAIYEFIKKYNQKSLTENQAFNLEEDKKNILQLSQTIFLEKANTTEKRANYLDALNREIKLEEKLNNNFKV